MGIVKRRQLKYECSGPCNLLCSHYECSSLPPPAPLPAPQIAVVGPTAGALALAAVGLPVAAGIGATGVGLGVAGVTGFIANLPRTIANLGNIGSVVNNNGRRRCGRR